MWFRSPYYSYFASHALGHFCDWALTNFTCILLGYFLAPHGDVIKWKHFLHYWPFLRGINRSPVNYPHKGQWRGAFMFSLICAGTNGWVITREAVIWNAIPLFMMSLAAAMKSTNEWITSIDRNWKYNALKQITTSCAQFMGYVMRQTRYVFSCQRQH